MVNYFQSIPEFQYCPTMPFLSLTVDIDGPFNQVIFRNSKLFYETVFQRKYEKLCCYAVIYFIWFNILCNNFLSSWNRFQSASSNEKGEHYLPQWSNVPVKQTDLRSADYHFGVPVIDDCFKAVSTWLMYWYIILSMISHSLSELMHQKRKRRKNTKKDILLLNLNVQVLSFV